MAVISKGITLSQGEKALTNLQEIPDMGGTSEALDITTLADAAFMYTDGIKSYGDSLEFTFLYDKDQFTELDALTGENQWKVALPDGATCSFSGTSSVKLNAVGVNAVLTYTLAIKPTSEMTWAAAQ